MSILTIFLAATLIGSITALGVNHVYAEDNHDDDKDKNYDKNKKYGKKITNNYATEGIGQTELTAQDAACESAGTSSSNGNGNDNGNHNGDEDDRHGTIASCNNVALSFNLNDGNNALGQQ